MGFTIDRWRIAATVVAAAALFTSLHAAAQTIPEESANYLTVDRTLSPLGADVFGEQVDLYMGGLSFSHTDVDVPGNSALPVQVVRTLVVGQASSARAFAHWELDLPHLYGVYAQSTGWAAMAPPPARGVPAARAWHRRRCRRCKAWMCSWRTSTGPVSRCRYPAAAASA